MAQQDRTEKATPKHRERARKKGQIARSADVGGSLVLAGGLFAITLLGPSVVGLRAGRLPRDPRGDRHAGESD